MSLAQEWTLSGEILMALAAVALQHQDNASKLLINGNCFWSNQEQRDEEHNEPDLPEEEGDEEEETQQPTTRKAFQEWRKKFDNNVQLSAELYQDRQRGLSVSFHFTIITIQYTLGSHKSTAHLISYTLTVIWYLYCIIGTELPAIEAAPSSDPHDLFVHGRDVQGVPLEHQNSQGGAGCCVHDKCRAYTLNQVILSSKPLTTL